MRYSRILYNRGVNGYNTARDKIGSRYLATADERINREIRKGLAVSQDLKKAGIYDKPLDSVPYDKLPGSSRRTLREFGITQKEWDGLSKK